MASVVNKLYAKNMINPPNWLPNNTMFEGWTGSVAYGASNDSSDMDVIGFCMPPKDMVFPHLTGNIPGFGTPPPKFEQWMEHHVLDKESRKEYDLTIFSIVKFFSLAMDNNPNMVDNLFLPRRCVLHTTPIYEHMRERRREFLHKGAWHKFRGYAMSQMSKINKGTNRANPKRQASIEKYSWDVKFGYHVVRLLLECEQIMSTGDLRLDRDSEVYKSIRAGEWDLEKLNDWTDKKEISLETLYADSKLPEKPDEEKIKELLLECLEMHYGNLQDAVIQNNSAERLVRDLEGLVKKYS